MLFKGAPLHAALMRPEALIQLAGNRTSWSDTSPLFLHLFGDQRVDLVPSAALAPPEPDAPLAILDGAP